MKRVNKKDRKFNGSYGLSYLVGKTLKYYNADYKKVRYKGELITIAERYSRQGKNIFYNLITKF